MAFSANPFKGLSLLRAAAYFFVFAICAKGILLFAGQHPERENLIRAQGVVRAVNLGGKGDATSLQVESEHGTQRYSSYYGKAWPGMERIKEGDAVNLLVERDRTNKNEMFAGKRYYIWELDHQGQTLIHYDEVRAMVQSMEATEHRYVNIWLAISFVLLLIAYVRKIAVTVKR